MIELRVRGRVRNGALELAEPLDLPDGIEVELTVREPVQEQPAGLGASEPAVTLAGLWAHRPEMADAEAWVRRLRGARE